MELRYQLNNHPVKFIHLRSKTWGGDEVLLKGGTTVAYSQERKDGPVVFSLARCASHDNYNRKIGRQIAYGRLKKFGGDVCNTWEEFQNFLRNLV